MNSFPEFGLLHSILKTLKAKKIYKPTEIQKNAIPLLMSGQSVVGVSETGSGKTLTYALPILHLIKSLEDEGKPVTEAAKPRALILLPTRDLAEQVAKVFKIYTHDTRLRVRTALGGTTLEQASRNVSGDFEVLLATPGRLLQLMDRNKIDFSDIKLIVFDEADQMLDQGFINDSKAIVRACPKNTPMALFSATVSKIVEELIQDLFKEAEVVRSSGSGKTVNTLTTKNETIIDGIRWPHFEKLIKQKIEGGTIVFTNTREQCDKLAEEIKSKGYACVVYRGEMDKTERRQNLKKFRDGEMDLLISTDLAARGLDLEHVGRVINYHLPKQLDNYLHRAGRTARAGRQGLVVNFVTERDLQLIAIIENKGQSVRDLKNRFKDKDGKRLHVAPKDKVKSASETSNRGAALKKSNADKVGDKNSNKPASSFAKKKSFGKKTVPKFKPKPLPTVKPISAKNKAVLQEKAKAEKASLKQLKRS